MDELDEPAIESERGPSLSDLLGVALALDDDELRDPAALRRRDRAVGIACEAASLRDPARRLVAWLAARNDAASSAAEQLRSALRWTAVLLGLAGFLFGWAASAGALAFEGSSGRINVVLVLALLVVAPALLLCLSLLAALPHSAARRVPGFLPLAAALRQLSTGRLALRLIPAERRDALAALWGRGVAQRRLYAHAGHWLVLALSQSAAAAFGAGALVGTLGLVVFTDLAFGWSTTLRIDSDSFHDLTGWVSLPWSGLWSEAVPSLALVESTRFFRVAPAVPEAVDPALYGGWWPFVVAAIGAYALLPRAAFAAFCGWRLRAAVRSALVETPGARETLERMQTPLLEAGHAGDGGAAPADDDAGLVWSNSQEPPGCVICWAQAADDAELARLFGSGAPAALPAGGSASLEQDVLAVDAASRASGTLVIVVRGFEPPVADLLDFLRALRRGLGAARRIDVLPLGAREEDLTVWSAALARLGDPWLNARKPPDAAP